MNVIYGNIIINIFRYINVNRNAEIIISTAFILICGFTLTRATKKLKLPNVTGYIIAGILIGPYVFKLIPRHIIDGLDFIADIALAFIAFDVGRYLQLSVLRENSRQVVIITLCESLIAGFIVTMSMLFIFKLPLPFSLLLGAIGSATAPASTAMTIRQYNARGHFVNLILQVVALDDAVALIAFSICSALVQALNSNTGLNPSIFLVPIFINLIAIAFGIFSAFVLNSLVSYKRSEDNRLILAIAIILIITGFCSVFDISPLLSCMALGTTYINISENKSLFKQINNFAPPILTMFFVLSGMRLNIPSLLTAGVIGVAYFIIRILGKLLGAFIGAKLSNAPPEVCKYFGLTLIPQAGVSIGLALLGQRILPPDMGSLLSTIILSSAVLYEMIGPASAKLGLYLSGSFPTEDES